MSNHLAAAANVRRLREIVTGAGATDAELAADLGMPVAAVKAVEELTATDDQVQTAAAAMSRIAQIVREQLAGNEGQTPEPVAAKSLTNVLRPRSVADLHRGKRSVARKFGEKSGRTESVEVRRDAFGRATKPVKGVQRDAQGKAIQTRSRS